MTLEEQALKDLEAGWTRLGVEIDASISTDIYGRKNLHLSRIEIEKSRRGQGFGTKAMEDLITLADQYGMLMTLSPSTDFGGSSKERLKRFYRRFGFVSNKGRYKDFTLYDSMYRVPREESGSPFMGERDSCAFPGCGGSGSEARPFCASHYSKLLPPAKKGLMYARRAQKGDTEFSAQDRMNQAIENAIRELERPPAWY